jgi:hypothetical protein
VKRIPQIRLIAYQNGLKKVTTKDNATLAKYKGKDGFVLFHKSLIKEWDKLPESV